MHQKTADRSSELFVFDTDLDVLLLNTQQVGSHLIISQYNFLLCKRTQYDRLSEQQLAFVFVKTGVGKMRPVRLRPVRLGPRVICV